VPNCPKPAGPRVTAAERRAQSQRRAEKGTTCWLAKEQECERSSTYAYDRDIATAIQASVRTRNAFAETSLWVTVQGRVVYVEGCVRDESQARELESLMRGIPHVQQALAIVTASPRGKVPYRRYRSE
jgi:osmotically-inducible protein OsmY